MPLEKVSAGVLQATPIRVGLIGATGYAGGELLRLLERHPARQRRWAGSAWP